MQALSVDAALLRTPRERGLRGCVHSVFRRVINIADEDGELFTIAARDIDNAPRTLIADAPGFSEFGVAPGDRVEAADDMIDIARRIRIRLGGARAWHAFLPRYPKDDSRLRGNVRCVRGHGGPAAFGAIAQADAASAAALMPKLLERRTAMLRTALMAGDIEAAQRHGQALLGLGQGLTPSGDDYLVGMFAVLHLPGFPGIPWISTCAAIVSVAQERTHAISVAALKAAAAGRVRESLSSLMQAMVEGSRDDVMPLLIRVLGIGSSSGADMVAGMLDGFHVAAALRDVNARTAALRV